MDKDLIRQNANSLERTSWILVFFGLLTQLSADYAFPSYNVVIGFWGAYCSFSKHGRATFACVAFTILSLILDVVFCNTNRKFSQLYAILACLIIFTTSFKTEFIPQHQLRNEISDPTYYNPLGKVDRCIRPQRPKSF